MLREGLLIALFEEFTGEYKSLAEVMANVKLDYLTGDEVDCLYEMLESWYEG